MQRGLLEQVRNNYINNACIMSYMRNCDLVCNSIADILYIQVVLKDLSLCIPAGKVTALCGFSGAGVLFCVRTVLIKKTCLNFRVE